MNTENTLATNTSWQQDLANGFGNIEELCQYLNLTDPAYSHLTLPEFPLRVPREFVDRMEKNNLNDPLLKQILPIKDELNVSSGFSLDPVGDLSALTESGVIHKYYGRVLLITTGSCAINCRYCFRKNFPYPDAQLNSEKLVQAIHYIQSNKDISEVILSGGDPLLLNDRKLFSLIKQLDDIKHIKRIRIHSRIPIVLPSRITHSFCNELSLIKKPIVLVVHSNHQNELNTFVKSACQKLNDCNITLLNQSVLLKDINDSVQQQCELNEKLFSYGVLPYYLHLLDKAKGTSHFEVDQNTALDLMQQIKKQLPGYLVPKLVREQAGALNKIMLA